MIHTLSTGSNHRAEMEENDGIARNRRKQNQQKYQATLKKLEKQNTKATSKLAASLDAKVQKTGKRKRIDSAKTENTSDDEIKIKKIHKKIIPERNEIKSELNPTSQLSTQTTKLENNQTKKKLR